MPGTDVHEVVQVHRRGLVELMQQWTRLKQDDAGDDLRLALAIDAQRFRLDSVIRWLDAADSRLKRAAAQPPPPTGPLMTTSGPLKPTGRTQRPGCATTTPRAGSATKNSASGLPRR